MNPFGTVIIGALSLFQNADPVTRVENLNFRVSHPRVRSTSWKAAESASVYVRSNCLFEHSR